MIKIKFKPTKNKFKYPFKTAHGLKEYQESLMVAITYNGLMGIGEAPAISYYPETMETMIGVLQQNAQTIERYAINEPKRFWHFLHHLLPANPFLISALDMAYWDLYTKMKGQSLQEIAELDKNNSLATDYTLGLDTEEEMLKKMADNPWPIYKVKVENEASINTLEKLVEHSNSSFRIDANAAWTFEEAKKFLPRLEAINIELIEQPLAKDNFEESEQLKALTNIPIIADEAFQGMKDLERCAQAFDGINIKLTKCSGLSPALDIVQEAKKKGLKLMLGCMNEAEQGTYMTAQIGHLFDYIDLDGAHLLDIPLKKLSYVRGLLQWEN